MQQSEQFDKLMACFKTLPFYSADKKVDLAWLEEHVGPWLEKEKKRAAEEPMSWLSCPFHAVDLKVLNNDPESRPLYYKWSMDNCPVWCTSETVTSVLPELKENTHPDVRAKICVFDNMQCKCGLVPDMKLSRTEKNYHRVFLTCGKREKKFFRTLEPCGFFQWMHAPLWKPKRPYQPTLDQFQAKHPRWQTIQTPQGEYFKEDQMGSSKPQTLEWNGRN